MEERDPIYTITTIRHTIDTANRAVGFYYDLKDAVEAVVKNYCDINELGYYHYVVIEEISQGVYAFPRVEWWYKWSGEKEQYLLIDKPEKFKRTVGWSLA